MSVPAIDTLLYFGRFNVAHSGYILVIQSALQAVQPQHGLVLIPSSDHPTWDKKALPFLHRVEMLRQAIQAELSPKQRKQVHIDELELKLQKEGGYTITALHAYLQAHPEEKRIGIVMGADAIVTFDQWKSWQEIVRIATIFVVPRADSNTPTQIYTSIPPALEPFTHGTDQRIFVIPLVHPSPATYASSSAVLAGHTEYMPKNVQAYTVLHSLL